MKGMASAKEYYVPPPAGRYPSKIVEASSEISKKGATMIKLTVEVREPAQFAGHQATDYIITDGSAGGGGIGKQKLRGLGIEVDASDDEIPDSVICQRLLGQQVLVEYENEPKMTESVKGSGKFDKAMTATDPTTGAEVQLQKLIVKGYFRHQVSGVQAQAPMLQQAPVQAQGFAPPQMPGQLPQQPQWGAPPQGQFAQPVQGQWAQPQQQLQGPPPGWAQPQQVAGPNGQAVPPWVAQQAQAPVEEPVKAKRAKKGE